MNIIELERGEYIPFNYTGIIKWFEFSDNSKYCKSFKGLNTIWYKDGLFHREDGPAVLNVNFCYWCLNGEFYSKEQWFGQLTPEQKIKALFNEENW